MFFCLLLIKKQGLVGRALITLHKAKGRSFNFSSFSLDCLLDLITKMPSLYAEIEMLQNEPLTCRFFKGKHLHYIPYRSTDPSPSCVAPCIIVFLVFGGRKIRPLLAIHFSRSKQTTRPHKADVLPPVFSHGMESRI